MADLFLTSSLWYSVSIKSSIESLMVSPMILTHQVVEYRINLTEGIFTLLKTNYIPRSPWPGSWVILMAMMMHRCNDMSITQCSTPMATRDAIGHCHWASICPVLPRWTPWSSILAQKSSCGIVKLLSKASIQKARNGPSNQLIKETSCVERSNTMIKSEELGHLSSYQLLTVDKNCWSY